MNSEAFHAHLDDCTHCKSRPFDLCVVGQAIMLAIMDSRNASISREGKIEMALLNILVYVTSGKRYEHKNPYLIPEVIQALAALGIEPSDWPGNGPPPQRRAT